MEAKQQLAGKLVLSDATDCSTPIKSQSVSQPAAKKKRISSEELLKSPDLTDVEHNLILLIEEKLQPLNKLGKLDLLDQVVSDMEELKNIVTTFKSETTALKETVSELKQEMSTIKKENYLLRESLLDLQSRSMRDNLIFSGIQETNNENPEETLKTFMIKELDLSEETVKEITFARVHRIGRKKTFADALQTSDTYTNSRLPPPRTTHRPIIARFEYHKQREFIRGLGKRLKGKPFGLNEQFPQVVMERRRALLPIYYSNRKAGTRVSLVSDKLYINNVLFKDAAITPWLFDN